MESNEHIRDEVLAGMVEGTLEAAERSAAREHLARCRRCLAAFADVVRYRAHTLSGGQLPAVDAALLQRAYALSGGQTNAEDRPDLPDRSLAARRRLVFRWGTGLAGLAAAAAVVWFVTLAPGQPGTLPLDSSQLTHLRAAVERASLREMIIPGGEGFQIDGVAADRGAPPAGDEAAAALLDRLAKSHEDGRLSAEGIAWLAAGAAALGRPADGRAYLRRPRAQVARDPRLQHLEAVLLYLDGDLRGAEETLRALRAAHPEDVLLAFNLAYLLESTGRGADARPLLEEVRGRAPGTPMAARAAEILRRVGQPAAPTRTNPAQ